MVVHQDCKSVVSSPNPAPPQYTATSVSPYVDCHLEWLSNVCWPLGGGRDVQYTKFLNIKKSAKWVSHTEAPERGLRHQGWTFFIDIDSTLLSRYAAFTDRNHSEKIEVLKKKIKLILKDADCHLKKRENTCSSLDQYNLLDFLIYLSILARNHYRYKLWNTTRFLQWF